MALPTDIPPTFLRDPRSKWKHDGFGHDRRQDIGVREPCFRVGPHSGLDLTGRGPIFSIAGGYVVVSRRTPRAGHALIEDVTIPGLAAVVGVDRIFPIYFHAAAPMVPVGTITGPRTRLGTIGDTGSGTSPGAFHLHLSIAVSQAAAESLIDNGTPVRRDGESVAAWAKRAGLVDPLLVLGFLDSLDKPSTDKTVEPANPAIDHPEGDPTMRYVRILQPGSDFHGRAWAFNLATGRGEWVDAERLALLRRADQAATGREPEVLDLTEAEAWRLFATYESLVKPAPAKA